MDRREMLALGAGAAAGLIMADSAGAAPAGTAPKMTGDGDGHFYSAANPVATADQKFVEATAMRLFARDDVAAARRKAESLWRVVVDYDFASQMHLLPDVMEGYDFRACMAAAASDANYPRVVRVCQPAHRWFGMDVPSCRWGGDNPDNAYRIVTVSGDARYVIYGQVQDRPPSYVNYQLVGDTLTMTTLGLLEGSDVQIAPDGSFAITIGPEPAAGRANHIQSQPGARYVMVRATMDDWTQQPDRLRIVRLDPPSRPPLTDDELAARACAYIVDDVYQIYWVDRLPRNMPANILPTPRLAGVFGGLPSQGNAQGNFELADDEAAVMTVRGDAPYRSFALHDLWYRTIDYWDRQSSLHNNQVALNADGSVTMVIAHQDPGVHNWIDTGGLRQTMGLQRWQGLRGDTDPKLTAPTIKVIKFSELTNALPAGLRRVTPPERAQQLARRRREYALRFVDS